MRRLGRIAFLTSIWVLLWGRISIANVASGIVLSMILLVLYPPPRTGARAKERFVLRPLPTIHLAGYILVQILVSNVQISKRILTPRSRLQSGVVTYEPQTDSKRLITFIATILAISPGTMPVRVETDPPLIAVHVLHLRDPDDTRRAIARLEELTTRALGTRAALEIAT
jgi:multicomponent Na+:H+ antiporter subunit E